MAEWGSLNRTPIDLKFGPLCRHLNQISHFYLPSAPPALQPSPLTSAAPDSFALSYHPALKYLFTGLFSKTGYFKCFISYI